MIRLRQAQPGNGKSYFAGVEFLSLLKRNILWDQKGKIKVRRKVATNLELNPKLLSEYGEYIIQWNGLEDLVKLRDCDVIFDDMGSYLDAQEWQKTPREVKTWFRLHEHYGVEIYGNCQDFKDIIGSVRRLVVDLEYVRKIVGSRRPANSKPKVKMIYGVFMIRKMRIDTSEKPIDKREYFGFPRIEFLRKKFCNVYDTLQDIQEGSLPPLKHVSRYCSDPYCKHHKNPVVSHI